MTAAGRCSVTRQPVARVRPVAWEWVPAVSAASRTAIIGGIGIWATFRAGREGRKHAEALSKQTAEHTERMAFDERQHKRLGDAYEEMLQIVARAHYWGDQVCPIFDSDEPLPDLPSEDDQFRVQALLAAYGSDEVQQQFAEFGNLLRSIRILAETVHHSRDVIDRRNNLNYRQQIDLELRPKLATRRRQLEKQVAAELRERIVP